MKLISVNWSKLERKRFVKGNVPLKAVIRL